MNNYRVIIYTQSYSQRNTHSHRENAYTLKLLRRFLKKREKILKCMRFLCEKGGFSVNYRHSK